MSTIDITKKSALTPLELHILLALVEEQRHGYGIKLDVETRTNGRTRLGSGTLYVAMDRLEKAGLVRSTTRKARTDAEKRRRRYFALTAAGKKALRRELHELDRLLDYARTLELLGEAETS